MSHFYTEEINTLILISLLKSHNIKRIIASPGTTNISFIGSVQNDDFFEVYSAADERTAAFMACGLAEESGEAVVISCTGATASRNYIPGLTEAYYRHLPVLAVTSTQHEGKVGQYVAQVIDRSGQFPDMVKKSIHLRSVNSREDENSAVTKVNEALLELNHNTPGPVHINLETTYSNNFSVKELPEYRVIQRVINENYPELPAGNIGIFVGAHSSFSEEETRVIDQFCESNNAIVICDQISNYRGKYRFLANLVNSQEVDFGTKHFDLIIYIGYIHGAYISFSGKELWRVNRDGEIRDPYRNLTYVFEMEEIDFFRYYSTEKDNNSIFRTAMKIQHMINQEIPKLPYSNMWIAKCTAGRIPENSILHFSILNSLRSWNYFETPETVLCFSNTGGYGIDGCLSSFIGSALANGNKEHYIIVGDLAFFYDINTLVNKIPSNVHIMLINNGVGTEFKNYNHRAAYFGDEADKYMAAKGHYGNKNPENVKLLCHNLNIQYIFAENKIDYLKNIELWLKRGNAPILYEIFTDDRDESRALELMNTIRRYKKNSVKEKMKQTIMGRIIKSLIRG